MRINRKVQYGLLLVLYLHRSGRTTIENAAEGLHVSTAFLKEVACELRKADIIKSIRGPSGGYELIGQPTVGDVCFALAGMALLRPQEHSAYRRGEFEHRALARLIDDFHFALSPAFRRKLVNVGTELVSAEMRLTELAKGRTH